MRASITIAGAAYPLIQVTVRRDLAGGELSAQLAGRHILATGAECVLTVEGASAIIGTVSNSDQGEQITTLTADLPMAIGTGIYAPDQIQARGSGMIRWALDFDVLPGDTINGIAIDRITHTMGTSSAWFTQAGY